jgi:hypothetical protein
VPATDYTHLQYLVPLNIGSSKSIYKMIPDSTIGDTWVISGKCKTLDAGCNGRAITWGNRF